MRTLITGSVTIIGAAAGGLVEVLSGFTVGPLAVLGGLAGLVGGVLLARQTYPRPRQRLDPERYPNRLIR